MDRNSILNKIEVGMVFAGMVAGALTARPALATGGVTGLAELVVLGLDGLRVAASQLKNRHQSEVV
jgi:hypothetical protein